MAQIVSAPIWPPDWSQFVPDLLSGAVTGIVAGAVILIVQNHDARRAERQNADFLWQGARSSIFMATASPWSLELSGLHLTPLWSRELEARVMGLPLRVWLEQLHYPVIAALIQCLEQVDLFRAAGAYLDDDVVTAIEELRSTRFLDPNFGHVVRGLIQEASNDDLIRGTGFAMSELQMQLQSAQEFVGSLPKVRVDGYREALRRLHISHDQLYSLLMAPDKYPSLFRRISNHVRRR